MLSSVVRKETPERLQLNLRARQGVMAGVAYGPPDRAPDLIFLHANGFAGEVYAPLLAPLGAQGFRVVALDQRGHGRTTLPADPAGRSSYADLAGDLRAAATSLGASAPVLAGHSMGATAGLLAAAGKGLPVRQIVLFEPVIAPRFHRVADDRLRPGRLGAGRVLARAALRRREVFESQEAIFAAYRGRGAFATWDDDALAAYVRSAFVKTEGGDYRLACDPAWEASNYLVNGHDPLLALRMSRSPAWILRSTLNSTCRVGSGRWLRVLKPDLVLRTVPGSTHFLPVEQPDYARRVLEAALRGEPFPENAADKWPPSRTKRPE